MCICLFMCMYTDTNGNGIYRFDTDCARANPAMAA